MAPKQSKKAAVRNSALKKKTELFKATMAIVRHICTEIIDSDFDEVTWIQSDLGSYSVAIMSTYGELCRRDAVGAANPENPVNADNELVEELPKDPPEAVEQNASVATGETGAPSTSNKKKSRSRITKA